MNCIWHAEAWEVRSHNFVSSGSLLASLIRVLRIHNFCQNRCWPRCSLRSKLAGTLFLTFFSKVFRTSLCKDFIEYSLRRGTCCNVEKVCAHILCMILGRASALVRISLRIRVKKWKKYVFFKVVVRISLAYFFFGANTFLPKKKKSMKSLRQLKKNMFFACFHTNPQWNPYESRCSPENHGEYLCTHFSTLQQVPLLSAITYEILTQTRPENLRKKR